MPTTALLQVGDGVMAPVCVAVVLFTRVQADNMMRTLVPVPGKYMYRFLAAYAEVYLLLVSVKILYLRVPFSF